MYRPNNEGRILQEEVRKMIPDILLYPDNPRLCTTGGGTDEHCRNSGQPIDKCTCGYCSKKEVITKMSLIKILRDKKFWKLYLPALTGFLVFFCAGWMLYHWYFLVLYGEAKIQESSFTIALLESIFLLLISIFGLIQLIVGLKKMWSRKE